MYMASSCSSSNIQSQCHVLLQPSLTCALWYVVLFLLFLWNSVKKIVLIFTMIYLFTCSLFLIKYRLVRTARVLTLIISTAKMMPGIY